jgi:small subunit ribosomal protein S1
MSEEVKSDLTNVQEGEWVKGKIVKIDTYQAFVDIGYKYDAILPISEVSSLHIEKITDVLNEGDECEVKILQLDDEEEKCIVSKKAVDADKAWERLQKVYESGETITAKIADVVKGGLVVDLGVRGFIPASLVELNFVEDFSDYKGREFELKVIEIDPEKNKLILSRKAVLEEEQDRKKEETLNALEPGQILDGTVQRLTDFGAFVDIGGVDGLVHVSQLAWTRVEHPRDMLSEGDQVKVKVLSVNRESERISLSIKETTEGPWDKVGQEIKEGDVITGTVKRLVSFGAFVEVYPGVGGLVHISQISRRHIATPDEVLEEGQEVKAKVLEMNTEQKRISLSIKEVEEKPSAPVKKEEKKANDDSQGGSGLNVTLGDVYPELRNLK